MNQPRSPDHEHRVHSIWYTMLAILPVVLIAFLTPQPLWQTLSILTLGSALYLAPTVVGLVRRHRQRLAIFMLNLLLGWTFLGWVVALVWACMKDVDETT